jgi:hypothetical protein
MSTPSCQQVIPEVTTGGGSTFSQVYSTNQQQNNSCIYLILWTYLIFLFRHGLTDSSYVNKFLSNCKLGEMYLWLVAITLYLLVSQTSD